MANDVKIKLAMEGAAVVASDFDRVNGSMGRLVNGADKVKAVLGGLGVGLSIGGMAAYVKGAINAADETSKLSQKVGVAVKDVAGLQLAFRQAGVGDAFASSMAKMSKSAADGSKAFDAMGISTKNSDGSLRSTRVLLGEVADKFAGYSDGAAKSALAQEIFGKAGADLIPLLNAGAQGLADYDAMAAKLGLTLSEETAKDAEKFNDTLDLIGQGTQGVARQMAAQLLPTLSGLADQFFTSMSEGDKLKKTADFLSSSMKLLYVAGLGVVEVFTTVGKTLGGVGAAVVAALSGDFAGAANILKEMKTDIGTGWKDTLKQMEGAWNATGSAAVESMAATQRTAKGTAPVLADLEKNSKAAESAAKALKKAHEDAIKAADKSAQARADIINKERAGIDAYMRSQTESYAVAVKGSQDALAAAQAEYDQYGMSKSQIAEITLLTMQSTQAKVRDGSEGYIALQKQIDNQKKLIGVLQSIEVRDANDKAAKDAADAWNKTADSINSTLTDALMRGFESGKDFAKNMRDTVVNMFKTLILRPIVSAIVNPIAQGVTGMLGLSSAAQAGTSAAGGFASSALGNLTIAGSSIAAIGSSVMTGISAGMAGTSLAGATAAYGAAGMSGVAGGLGFGSSVGSALAAIGPVGWGLLAAAAVAAVVDFSGETRSGADYKVNPVTGQFEQGYTVSGGEMAGKEVRSGIGATTAAISALLLAMGSSSTLTGFQAGLNTSDRGRGGVFAGGTLSDGKTFGETGIGDAYKGTKFEKTSTMSPDAKAAVENFFTDLNQVTIQALQAASDVPKTIADMLAGVDAEALTKDAAAGLVANIDAMTTSVAGFQAAAEVMPFERLKGLSFDAAAGLIKAAGGMDNLVSSAAAWADKVNEMVAGISASVDSSIFGMQYGLADAKGKYDMLDVKGAGINDQMLASDDINQIAKLANDQIALLNQAWGLLDADQQKSSMLQYESKLEAINTFVTQKGADEFSRQDARDEKMAKTIAEAVQIAVAKAMEESSQRVKDAAAVIATAAAQPVTANVSLTVTAPEGSEVSIRDGG